MAIENITPHQLQEMLQSDDTLQLIDVRSMQEYQELGHIPGAQLMPIYELPFGFETISKDTPAILICQHGERSLNACYFLEAQGYDKLYNLHGGMADWENEKAFGPSEAVN